MTTHSLSAPARRHATSDRPSRRRVASVAAAGILVVATFQVALAVGAPFGSAAFGGANAGTLPLDLRLVSGLAAVVWVLAGLTAVGALMNAASSSPWERFGWAPFTLSLSILCIVLARSGRDSGDSVRAV